MSIRYLNAIFEAGPALGVTPTELLVLHVLADHADEAGDSYPGIDLITHRCGSTRRQSIQAAIAKLEAAGLVIRTINGAHDSRIRADRRPNLYHLTILDEAPDGVTQTATPNPPERGHGNRDPEAATGSRFPLNGVTLCVATGSRKP